MTKGSASSARGGRAATKGPRTRPRRQIDFSDIPELSAEQLGAMRRVGPDVLDRFRKEAKRRKVGYQTLINQVLAEYVQKHVA